MKVGGRADWHCAVDQSHTAQRTNEHPGVSVLHERKHWTSLKAQHIALVGGAEDVGRTQVAGVERCPPARAYRDVATKIQPVEVCTSGGGNRHAEVAIANAYVVGRASNCRGRPRYQPALCQGGRYHHEHEKTDGSCGSHRVSHYVLPLRWYGLRGLWGF